MEDSDDIPSEIWREILLRLPAESLIRSRAVCTGFRAVIDDPCFVRAHTNKHQQQLSSSSIILNIRRSSPQYALDLEALSFSNEHQAIAATPLDFDLDLELCFYDAVAACHGLILSSSPYSIWNPLTHERLDLPDPTSYKIGRATGLGYDCATDDYKAVAISVTLDTYVYSLKPDSWRRIIKCPGVGDGEGPMGPGVFVSGALNWLSMRNGGAYDYKIVALDMGTEKFSQLQMPRPTIRNRPIFRNHLIELNVLGGCLALSDCFDLPESLYAGFLYVWVMKDYGDEDSWIKLFSIEKEPNISMWSGFLCPIAFFRKDRLVFLQDDSERVFMFDVETKSLKWLVIDGSGKHTYAQQMFGGTIFRLHANCGGGRKIAMSCREKKRKKTSCTKKRKKCTKKKRKICIKKKKKMASCTKKKACADGELVFCIRDANGDFFGSCSERGLSGENEDGTKLLEDSICS